MSELRADTITSATDNTDLEIQARGTGVPNLESGTKLNGVALGVFATGTSASNLTGALPALDGSALTGISSGLNLLSTATASNSASINFVNGSGGAVIDTTYDMYLVTCTGVVPATDNVYFNMRFGNGSIPTTNYAYDMHDTVNQVWSSTSATGVLMCDTNANKGAGNGTYENLSATIWIPRFNSAGTYYQLVQYDCSYVQADNTFQRQFGIGSNLGSPGAADRFQFYFSSGNISVGEFKLYGLSA